MYSYYRKPYVIYLQNKLRIEIKSIVGCLKESSQNERKCNSGNVVEQRWILLYVLKNVFNVASDLKHIASLAMSKWLKSSVSISR